jgi:hypothetical protein
VIWAWHAAPAVGNEACYEAGIVAVISTVAIAAIVTISVAYVALVSCRYVLPAADRLERRIVAAPGEDE